MRTHHGCLLGRTDQRSIEPVLHRRRPLGRSHRPRPWHHSPVAWALIAIAGLIRIGSFLFHTVATRWAELADTGPI
ncbi:MAG: hypothetical protein WAT09_09480 [Paracoccaceae bacterium]